MYNLPRTSSKTTREKQTKVNILYNNYPKRFNYPSQQMRHIQTSYWVRSNLTYIKKQSYDKNLN